MTRHRPPPGPLVATGFLRVDAERAIAKLRAYRLADPVHWILEAIRAAVGAGAARLALDGDADDVWLRWWGPAWPAAGLPRLFDELVSPEAAVDGYPRRLLASAVNSGLGLEPAWIDVVTTDGGAVTRVRFTPGHVEPDADGVAALDTIVPEVVPRPPALGDATMLVHLRRRFGWSVLGRFLRGAEPPELVVARSACTDLGVELLVDRAPLSPSRPVDELVRVPLAGGLDGFVTLRAAPPAGAPATPSVVDYCELGVRIARERWAPSNAVAPLAQLRLVIDAPRLPTNASRSQVRVDDPRLAAALRHADEALGVLVQELTARATGHGLPEPLRAAALTSLAGAIAGPTWPTLARTATGPVAALAALPLVRDAVGRWRPVASSWGAYPYRADEPQPAELARWLGGLAWGPPGDPVERLLGSTPPFSTPVKRALAAARRGHAARAAFLAQPRGAVELSVEGDVVARTTLAVPADAEGEALHGQLCVLGVGGGGRLAVFLEGRPLATVRLPPPLAIAAAVECPDVTPDLDYRGVVYGSRLRRVVTHVRAAAVEVVGDALADGEGASPLVVRAALAVAIELGHELDAEHPLVTAAAWPLAGGGWTSLATLRSARAVAVVEPTEADDEEPARGPAARPTVQLRGADRGTLATLLGEIPLLSYDGREPWSPASAERQAAMLAARLGTAALAVREPERHGAIAAAASPYLILRHRGVQLDELERTGAYLPTVAVVDSDRLVPTLRWDGIDDDGGAAAGLAAWELALVHAIVGGWLGDEVAGLHVAGGPLAVGHKAVVAALAVIADADPLSLLGPELLARLAAQPLWPRVGDARLHSLDELRQAFAREPIPVVEELPAAGEPAEAGAVVAPGRAAEVIAALTGRPTRLVWSLPRRRAGARRRSSMPPVFDVDGTDGGVDTDSAAGVLAALRGPEPEPPGALARPPATPPPRPRRSRPPRAPVRPVVVDRFEGHALAPLARALATRLLALPATLVSPSLQLRPGPRAEPAIVVVAEGPGVIELAIDSPLLHRAALVLAEPDRGRAVVDALAAQVVSLCQLVLAPVATDEVAPTLSVLLR